jgi:hypothetical protein
MTSIREYLETECGYGPHVASERVRVAEVLDAMPTLEQALGEGALSYSAVRELATRARAATKRARVATKRAPPAIVRASAPMQCSR